jgi:hypothetical protein
MEYDWATSVNEDRRAPEKIVKDQAIKRILRNNEIHTIKAKALSDLCLTPKEGEQYRIITEKQFSAFAFLLNILQRTDIEELYLALFRINQPTVETITDYIKAGRIKKAYFLISDFFHQTKKPEAWAKQLRRFCDTNGNARHAYLNIHAKVCLAKTPAGEHLIFEGSGNMTINARVEQYVYENNKQVFEFHRGWITDLINRGDGAI